MNVQRTAFQASLLVTGLVALPGSAQGVRFGVQASIEHPTGYAANENHLDGRNGYGVGINLPISLGSGHFIRPELSYHAFSINRNGVDQKSSSTVLGASYNYYPSGGPLGLYLIGGLGLHSTRREYSTSSVSYGKTSSGLAYNFGLGYAFSGHVAMELKSIHHDMSEWDISGHPFDKSYTADGIAVSVGYTF